MMGKKYLHIITFASVLIVVFFTIVKANNNGATYGVVGAPDDQVPGSCGTTAGQCHNIAPITDSPALKITMIDPTNSQSVTTYQAGKKYTIKVELRYRSLVYCGFQSTIEIPKSPYTHYGTMTPQLRSQIITNPSVPSAQYATHLSQVTAGKQYGMWEYYWTAPKNYFGDLVIYAAGNAANPPGGNLNYSYPGDTIFNTSITISHNAAIENNYIDQSNVSIFPNPAKDNFTLSYSLPQEENTSINLYNSKGQQVKSIQSGILPQGENKINGDVKGLPTGLYFVRITSGSGTEVAKIMVGQ